MLCDHVSEEIRKTQKISTESAFRMFKKSQTTKNQLFDPSKEMNLVRFIRNSLKNHKLF